MLIFCWAEQIFVPPQFAISTFRGKIWNLGPHPGNGSARSQLPFFFKPSRFLCCEIPYILPVVEYFTSGIFRKFETSGSGNSESRQITSLVSSFSTSGCLSILILSRALGLWCVHLHSLPRQISAVSCGIQAFQIKKSSTRDNFPPSDFSSHFTAPRI